MVMILEGNCLDEMKKLPADSVDSIVTDPPYGLAFMGKKWDYDVPSVAIWREALRVLKPGGYLLSFAGSRTYHRMAINIEDAGFELRDQIMWIYGSGFPKSHKIGRAIDKESGYKGELLGSEQVDVGMQGGSMHSGRKSVLAEREVRKLSPEAQQWEGWGTALKPAHEPIVVARKPFIGTVAHNILKHGTGGLNIDECRVGTEKLDTSKNRRKQSSQKKTVFKSGFDNKPGGEIVEGRFPSNVIHDGSDEVLEGFPHTKSGDGKPHHVTRESQSDSMSGKNYSGRTLKTFGDEGSAARFFYCAKTSQSERHAGCEELEGQEMGRNQSSLEGGKMLTGSGNERSNRKKNFHPTVKPISLMEYLCRLVTQPEGTVLDPFMGSGTTGIAASRLGFKFIGIEMTPEYIEIAATRIAHWSNADLSFDDGEIKIIAKPKAEWL
jgi:site-specific DNA-methyltransferase (adenine-specific)